MTKFDYYSNDYSCSNQGPNAVHWFGTDNLGRDLWTRVWAGGRVSLIIAILATLIPEIIGMAVGGISGYLGGWADTVIMRTIDVLMGIPSLIYMILLMVVMGERKYCNACNCNEYHRLDGCRKKHKRSCFTAKDS